MGLFSVNIEGPLLFFPFVGQFWLTIYPKEGEGKLGRCQMDTTGKIAGG